MVKFLDLNYYFNNTKNIKYILKKHNANLGFLYFLPKSFKVFVFNRTQVNERLLSNRINYVFHKKKGVNVFDILFRYHKLIKKLNPDYILIHGMGYGLYSFFIKSIVRKETTIIVQVHGYVSSPKWIKKVLYNKANRYIDGYIFTGKSNAKTWVEDGVFENNKVFEIMEGSTNFKFNSKQTKNKQSFIWVGRLDKNKDPITILNAFKEFLKNSPNAKLTMVYNSYELLNEVEVIVNSNLCLRETVILLGKTDHTILEALYNKHEYFILGSHYEGSGYALTEAMSCRCVPIITNIPSYNYMTNNGDCALLFKPGDEDELLTRLNQTLTLNVESMKLKVAKVFEERLSFLAIANNIQHTFEYLSKKKNRK